MYTILVPALYKHYRGKRETKNNTKNTGEKQYDAK